MSNNKVADNIISIDMINLLAGSLFNLEISKLGPRQYISHSSTRLSPIIAHTRQVDREFPHVHMCGRENILIIQRQ